MKYEMVIRNVFKCDRWGDPAKEADAGYFNDSNLRSVKILLGYCTLVLESQVSGHQGMEAFCEGLHQQIDKAESAKDLESVVDDLSAKLARS